MPLNKFLLILISVITAAGVTVWIGAVFMANTGGPATGWLIFVPVMLATYVIWRAISRHLDNRNHAENGK